MFEGDYKVMYNWIIKHKTIIITISVSIAMILYLFGCESKVKSLNGTGEMVNRQEIQLELEGYITTAKLRLASLDKQDEFRTIILQNALILVQGQPFNPLGILSAMAAIYGIAQGSTNITQVVKNKRKKKRDNNGK